MTALLPLKKNTELQDKLSDMTANMSIHLRSFNNGRVGEQVNERTSIAPKAVCGEGFRLSRTAKTPI